MARTPLTWRMSSEDRVGEYASGDWNGSPSFSQMASAARRPSAQAYTVRGLAETNLGRWREAEASFLKAYSLHL